MNTNSNRLSIPELEQQIADLQRQIQILSGVRPPRPFSMYVCTRCDSLYQSVWGCGCIQAEQRKTA